jgi:uncharacterized phage-like protein YoqJ
LVIAVTGHRPEKLYGYDLKEPRYKKLYQKLLDKLIEYKPTHCISGMALGVDTVFAYAVLEYKKKVNPDCIFECAIPCLNHPCKWKKEDQERYSKILKKADMVTLVSDEEYKPWLMQKRNEYMVDKCDLLIAVWDGTKGGTGNCINYAKKKDKTIDTIDPREI